MIREAFEKLRSGCHLSIEDGECYRALADNEKDFTSLFASLGFALINHRRGFFYFKGGSGYSSFGSKVAVFFFILVEWISDSGGQVEEYLFNRLTMTSDLPHLKRDRYKQYMADAGIETEDSLGNLLKRMERLGFIRFQSEGIFRFKNPSYRLLDLCSEIIEEEEGKTAITMNVANGTTGS